MKNLMVSLFAVSKGAPISKDDFYNPLSFIGDGEQPIIEEFIHGLEDFENQEQCICFFSGKQNSSPSGFYSEEDLPDAVSDHLSELAPWINKRREILIEIGKTLDLTMYLPIDTDTRAELILPPSFLAACGNAEIEIRFVSYMLPSND